MHDSNFILANHLYHQSPKMGGPTLDPVFGCCRVNKQSKREFAFSGKCLVDVVTKNIKGFPLCFQKGSVFAGRQCENNALY